MQLPPDARPSVPLTLKDILSQRLPKTISPELMENEVALRASIWAALGARVVSQDLATSIDPDNIHESVRANSNPDLRYAFMANIWIAGVKPIRDTDPISIYVYKDGTVKFLTRDDVEITYPDGLMHIRAKPKSTDVSSE